MYNCVHRPCFNTFPKIGGSTSLLWIISCFLIIGTHLLIGSGKTYFWDRASSSWNQAFLCPPQLISIIKEVTLDMWILNQNLLWHLLDYKEYWCNGFDGKDGATGILKSVHRFNVKTSWGKNNELSKQNILTLNKLK